MRLFSRKKIGKIKFILLGLGFFLVTFPVISVYADTVAPTITVGSENSFSKDDSPGLSNIFKITSPEENRILIGCPISTVDGLIGNTIKSIETITYTRFDSGIRAIECPSSRSDISSAPSNTNGTGILGVLNLATGSILEQRPASGIQFAEEKIYAITNPGKVYAQDPANYFPGTGFDLLQPVRSFWGWSVNLVFGILIVIILFVAFAIILGDRMPGNMKVTLQSAIPNIALAMILVPLSYAISGLFIDFITVGSNAVHDFVLGPASPGYSVYLEREQGANDRGLYIDDERLTWINARTQVDVRQEVDNIASGGTGTGGINDDFVFQIVASILNVFAQEETTNVGTNPSSASAWLGTIVNAILSILMIWIGIKILIRLFKKYLSLMIMPIFSPFVFATIAVPGNGTKPIVTYTKSLAAASLGFIVTYLMFLLTIVFSNTAFQSSIPDFRTGLWVPPLIGITQLEELTGSGAGLGIIPFILGLIALGIYFSIPKVLDQIDDALGAKFSLPEFVRTPIESFRESARVTGGFAFRTAPRALGRTANIVRNAPGAALNLKDNVKKLPRNLDQGLRRVGNDLNIRRQARLRREQELGITANDPNSILYAPKRVLDTEYADAQNKYNLAASNSRISQKEREDLMAEQKGRMKGIEFEAELQGITLSKSLKPEEQDKLNVTFESAIDDKKGSSFLFSTDYIDRFQASGKRDLNIDSLGKIKISLQSQNLKFTPETIIYVHRTITATSPGNFSGDFEPSSDSFPLNANEPGLAILFSPGVDIGLLDDILLPITSEVFNGITPRTSTTTSHFGLRLLLGNNRTQQYILNANMAEIPLAAQIPNAMNFFGPTRRRTPDGSFEFVGGTLADIGIENASPGFPERVIFAIHEGNLQNGRVIARSDKIKLSLMKVK